MIDYPVAPFSGTKSLVFSTVSFIGGRNPFLGIAYIAAGGTCVVLGLLLTARHLIRPRRLGDLTYLRFVLRSLCIATVLMSRCAAGILPEKKRRNRSLPAHSTPSLPSFPTPCSFLPLLSTISQSIPRIEAGSTNSSILVFPRSDSFQFMLSSSVRSLLPACGEE